MENNNIIAVTANGTIVYSHPEAHPHRMDIAAEAIRHMVVPEVPADPSDRSQTKVVSEYDFGRVIGVCHLVEVDSQDDTYYATREPREYKSHMALQQAVPETVLTSVVIWCEERWILLTNYEGAATAIPEPGCESFNEGTPEEQTGWREFWYKHALVPTKEQILKHIKEREEKFEKYLEWFRGWEYAMPTLEWIGRDREVQEEEAFIKKMKAFAETLK